MRRLTKFANATGRTISVLNSPNFLTPEHFLREYTGSKRKPFMAKFYEAQRKRMGVLIDQDGAPHGGRWSFDEDNRKRLPKGHVPPAEPYCRSRDWVNEAKDSIVADFPDNPGEVTHFRWPVTHDDADRWLQNFFAERFEKFGEYEDAISVEHNTLYHAAITPMLNIGLLDPQDVLSAALAADGPLNSREGFVRRVIGWREFIRGVYIHRGVEQRTKNFWRFERKMPEAFYDGTTGIPPVDRVIRNLLNDGWCHHIERLMVLGNFILLCRIHPDEVYRWFMEMFVDSYDWVMAPNVYGMSQFADGGISTTKPYISGSNYIRKMSDEPAGPWCEVWDGLYWSFIADHIDFFRKNPRLSMMAVTWAKMSDEKIGAFACR